MSFFLLAYYNDIVVGAVCCRIDQTEDARRLYIMTLGCLAPYRRLGIGKLTEIQNNVLLHCVSTERSTVGTIYTLQWLDFLMGNGGMINNVIHQKICIYSFTLYIESLCF